MHEIGAGYPDANIIIDTMLNLPLLYGSGNPAYFDMARNHAITAAHTLVREDYSTFHGYLGRLFLHGSGGASVERLEIVLVKGMVKEYEIRGCGTK